MLEQNISIAESCSDPYVTVFYFRVTAEETLPEFNLIYARCSAHHWDWLVRHQPGKQSADTNNNNNNIEMCLSVITTLMQIKDF